MREIFYEEREQIKSAKKEWKKHNRNRKLYKSDSLSDIEKLIELSDYANNLLKTHNG